MLCCHGAFYSILRANSEHLRPSKQPLEHERPPQGNGLENLTFCIVNLNTMEWGAEEDATDNDL